MSNFLSYIQPTIVKFGEDPNIPVSLQNQYVINFNALGIKWFEEHFIVCESGNGFMLQEEPMFQTTICPEFEPFKIMLEDSGANKFDIPRVYILIKEEYINDDSKIKEYITKALTNNSIYGEGIQNFRPGIHYFVNETLYLYLTRIYDSLGNEKTPFIDLNDDIKLPNYLVEDGSINTPIFVELTQKEQEYSNLVHYWKKNQIVKNNFSEDQINDFYATFCKLILDMTTISGDSLATKKNQIYNLVLHYFANHMTDAASLALNLILNTPYTTANPATSGSNCGCNGLEVSVWSSSTFSTLPTAVSNTSTCYDLYKSSMLEWLKKMLGDDEFYRDWFIIDTEGCSFPNTDLIEQLKDLIEAFKSLGYDLDFSTKKRKNCVCPTISTSSSSDTNYKIIDDYIKVLNWVENCEIDPNINKIKVYGEKFGTLLPNLQF